MDTNNKIESLIEVIVRRVVRDKLRRILTSACGTELAVTTSPRQASRRRAVLTPEQRAEHQRAYRRKWYHKRKTAEKLISPSLPRERLSAAQKDTLRDIAARRCADEV